MIKIDNNIVPKFLLSPNWRVWRHLLLWGLIFFISAGFIWNTPGEYGAGVKKAIGLAFYMFVFMGGIYLNIYCLVPKLLLKNRLWLYFISLLGVVFLIIVLIFIAQESIYQSNTPLGDVGYGFAIISSLSAVISFVFLFAGTGSVLLFKHWMTYMQRVDELESATLQSELKLLKDQINPHFLFNMLNNANVLIKRRREEASEVLFKLEDLLRYQINDSSRDKVLLTSDIRFLDDFLKLEKIRRDKFEYVISKEGIINEVWISPLLFIPFVENAVKHNPDSENESYVYLTFKVWNNKLEFRCENSKPVTTFEKSSVGGLGLKNVKRRLELLYADRHSLEIKEDDKSYVVNMQIEL
ncbi:sensor histidine kinase [Dysgonomonas sp. ZJ709]|uniref:sensor histidine kinase n=1 Tax=Dysgonomonas sp. ZJ709 TaxID=2709797 RepID=UPI0013EDEB77|nr:histidine kinase [Dysgonomonas sp. ZJ709]